MRESSKTQFQTVRPRGPLDSVVIPPGSKSITNRAMLLAAFCDGSTILDGVLDSEDTRIMFEAMKKIGWETSYNPQTRRMEVWGRKGRFPIGIPEIYIGNEPPESETASKESTLELYVGNSGTTARFLAAALCFADRYFEGRNYRIDGKPRMRQRPIHDLVDALRQLGADIRCENNDDCPPLIISSMRYGRPECEKPRIASVSGSVSSQYLSALLMAAPLATDRAGVEIRLVDRLVSRPYVVMTLRMMETFGVVPRMTNDFSSFYFDRQSRYGTPVSYRIEPDASAASYFFAAAAVCGGTVRIPGLSNDSLQGDVRFVDCLERMGCSVRYESNAISVSRDPKTPLRGISVDMNSISDTAQTLAVVALFAEGPTEISNIEHVRFKETDRIADLATELRRFGTKVEEHRDGLRIIPPEELIPAAVETYDDHRMAMSFAVAGLRLPGVTIRDPDCTAKTFPDFFHVLETLD